VCALAPAQRPTPGKASLAAAAGSTWSPDVVVVPPLGQPWSLCHAGTQVQAAGHPRGPATKPSLRGEAGGPGLRRRVTPEHGYML
jgi:hypothetical protein